MIQHKPMEQQGRTWPLLFLFPIALACLTAGLLSSLKWGAAPVTWTALYEALTLQGQDKMHLYIQTLRLPRALTAMAVGSQLALAGLLTQLITKNPLASPHIFGINAGASLAVVSGLAFLPGLSPYLTVLLAFIGAAGGAVLIRSLAGKGQKQVVLLALSGITIHFLLSSLTEGLIIFNQHSTDSIMFWLVGSVSQAVWTDFQVILPFFIGGLALFGIMLPSFRLLIMDEELAAGLGQRVAVVRSIAIVLILLLSGSAVAICGPIGFICLIVPHIARALVGSRLSVLAPFTAILGGTMLVVADVISRFISYPYESPVGIVTSAIGAPFFIYLTRKKGGSRR